MSDCIKEGVALALIVAEVASDVGTAAGCSCKPDMIPANLVSKPKWWPTSKIAAAVVRYD